MPTNTAPAMKAAPRASILDSLMSITRKDLKEAHYRIRVESHEGRERAGRLFRITQPGICAYLPYTPSTISTLAYENALICSFARHLCAAVENRYGSAPVLKLQDLLVSEVQARALLADPKTMNQVKKLGAVQFAEGGILGVHYFHGIGIIPDQERVLLKVLTLLLCFSAAVKRTPISQATNHQPIYHRHELVAPPDQRNSNTNNNKRTLI